MQHHRHIPLVLGIMLLITPFMPATNLLVTVGFVVAERVLYIPSVGCVLLVVYGAQNLWESIPKSRCIIIIMSVLLLTAGCLKTLCRNKDWNSRESLLRWVIKIKTSTCHASIIIIYYRRQTDEEDNNFHIFCFHFIIYPRLIHATINENINETGPD